jgi:hypothetical protein
MRARLLPLFMAVAASMVGCRQPLAPSPQAEGAAQETSDPQARPDKKPGNPRPKVSSALQTLADRSARERRPLAEIAQELNLRTEGDLVQVQVRTSPEGQKAAQAAFVAVGGKATKVTSDGTLVQGWVPVTAFEALAAYPEVLFIEGPTYLIPM